MVFPFSLKTKLTCEINWKNVIRRHVPIVAWIPNYTLSKLLHDIVAGITISLTEVPQSIAYASIAGLDPQYGLYSGYMGLFVYFIFGSCKDINIGPTGLLSLMIQPYVEQMGADAAVLMAFISGIIILLMGILHLGFIVEFFSYPVIAGFTTAAAIQTGSAQLTNLLGIPEKSSEFLESWITTIQNITQTSKWDAVLGCCTLVILIAIKEIGKKGSTKIDPKLSRSQNATSLSLWILSLTRYAMVVIVGTVMAYIFYANGIIPFQLTGTVEKGVPAFTLPSFSTTYNNVTYSFTDMLSNFQSSLAFIPMISILEHVSIAKAFAHGKTIDGTQEMIALGLGNFVGSFAKSMPITGSFTRTAVNYQSGVKTTAGGFFTACLVLLCLTFLTSFFYYIPKATLAAVVISAMLSLVEYEAVPILWRSKKIDIIPYVVTVLVCLLWSLEYGILVGIAVNIFFPLYITARPKMSIEPRLVNGVDVFLVEFETGLQFPSAEFIKESVLAKCTPYSSLVVIDGQNIDYIDATVGRNLKAMADNLRMREQSIVFWNFQNQVIDVCTSLDKKMIKCFFQGTLEEVIDKARRDEMSALKKYDAV